MGGRGGGGGGEGRGGGGGSKGKEGGGGETVDSVDFASPSFSLHVCIYV